MGETISRSRTIGLSTITQNAKHVHEIISGLVTFQHYLSMWVEGLDDRAKAEDIRINSELDGIAHILVEMEKWRKEQVQKYRKNMGDYANDPGEDVVAQIVEERLRAEEHIEREKQMINNPIFVKELRGCARCGQVHFNLRFDELTFPCGEYTHWAQCPSNGEPILMYAEEIFSRKDLIHAHKNRMVR
jgi:hypothetical protein